MTIRWKPAGRRVNVELVVACELIVACSAKNGTSWLASHARLLHVDLAAISISNIATSHNAMPYAMHTRTRSTRTGRYKVLMSTMDVAEIHFSVTQTTTPVAFPT